MSDDTEMNDVSRPLMVNNDENLPEVDFKQTRVDTEFTGLSKEELEVFAKDPFWKKLRIILFVIFWLIWVGMLIAAILIVVLSPKCPKRPKLDFWEKKTGYWVDTLGFVDSNGDKVGDIDGLITRLDYIQKQLGAGYLILDPVFVGQYSEPDFGAVNSFRDLDTAIGNKELFKKLLKECRKRGLEIVLAVDFNALHKSSEFLKNNPNASMKYDSQMEFWRSRDGGKTKRGTNPILYNSGSENTSMIELDLTNEVVLTEIKESVKMWLKDGVRGFLLTNVAFYVENVTIATTSGYYSNISNWYQNQSIGGQIFSDDTKQFLKQIRQIMNEVATKTDRSRLLIVEAGNVGLGLEDSNLPDIMLKYLDGPERIADMIVGREFLSYRGWNIKLNSNSRSSVQNYLKMIPEDKRNRVALTSATSTSIQTSNLLKLAAPFLLPGNPILYYGSELGTECDIRRINSTNSAFYPQNRKFPLESIDGEFRTKCNHMIMPWDNNGHIFSNGVTNYTFDNIINPMDTVQGHTAIGKEETVLQFHQKLIKIRDEPSLLWGNIKMLQILKINSGSYEIFVREAEGFPKIIVALIEDDISGKVFSFAKECAKVMPLLVYPANPNLPENKEVDAGNIYLKIGRARSVHVFKCAA